MTDTNRRLVTDVVERETLPRIMSTQAHAQRLLAALIHSGHEGKELMVADLKALYRQRWQELNWRPRPWNPLAKQFRLITTGPKKVYRWFDFTDGVRRRVRVFPIISNPQLHTGGAVACRMEQSRTGQAVA